jgi:CBS domain-containing protein
MNSGFFLLLHLTSIIFTGMKANTLIRDIMTKDVITALPDDTISRVKEKIVQNVIHHIPVVENGDVKGMISMNDIHRVEHHFTLFDNPEAEISNKQLFSTMLAKEIMTSPVIKISENEKVTAAVDLFLENMFHALPVCGMP